MYNSNQNTLLKSM